MNIFQIILALACFGVGFLIADDSITSSPVMTGLVVVAILGVSVLLRYFGNKKDK